MNGAEGEFEVEPASLDGLVTSVAGLLMGVDAASLRVVAQSVLRTLIAYFEVDHAFLRFHDTTRRTTVLVAEWPPRDVVPEPDPLGVISFEHADPVFARTEHLTDIYIVRPDVDSEAYQRTVQSGSGVVTSSAAGVPLLAGSRTTGLLGFVKEGDRGWSREELRTLRTIALLLAQLQARVAAEGRLRHLAHHDELTGLPNRRALLAHLEESLGDGVTGQRAVLFVDVDRLKAMNDFLGHEAGDRFIVEVARRLQEAVGGLGMVARLGGDEFVVAIDGPTTEAEALAVATRTQEAVRQPVTLGGQSLGRTISVGVALATPGVTTITEWLRNADQAVLAAKERGGNTAAVFTAEMAAREQVRVAVEMNLLSTIRAGLLTVHFQPIVDLRTGVTVCAEALLRWNHPTLGAVPPELFVGVAEATNLAGELGDWVLNEACRQLAQWRAALPHLGSEGFSVAVNVSPVQLIAIDFVDRVADALARHGLSGTDLTLEVTEHAVVSDVDAAIVTLRGLRQLGIDVAIDDFGTGYSSLAQLKSLPVTILKIDRGFVRDLAESPDDLAIVRSIVGLAESFGLALIAEGVETEVAAATLLAMGCVTAQGHLFSRPIPGDEVLHMLSPASPAVAAQA